MANAKKRGEAEIKVVATNRRASFQYEILETIEAGIALTGPEVKSLRQGHANLQDGFARIEGTRPMLWNVDISPYAQGSLHVVQEPTRKRVLLMNRTEINRWLGKTTGKGLTIIPLELYFNQRGRAKVKLGLARGKKGPDKREDLKKKTLRRELQRGFGDKYKLK